MGRVVQKVVVAAMSTLISTAALAYSRAAPVPQGRQLPTATALAETGPALAPLAFLQFCKAYEGQCAGGSGRGSIALDARSWDDLQQVNATINAEIAPDAAKGGFDWSLETRFGNCNDYAVQKRHALVKMGYPISALSLAVVLTPFGEGHLVLTVRTDRGDFVLDNRRKAIVPWNRTGYAWLKRQSAEDPRYWVAVAARPARPARSTDQLPAAKTPTIEKPSEGLPSSPVESDAAVTVAQAKEAPAVPVAPRLSFPLDLANWAGFVPAAREVARLEDIVAEAGWAGSRTSFVALAFNGAGELRASSQVE